jgi:3-oxoacyl-[acyl-carrier-protein] synthase-3
VEAIGIHLPDEVVTSAELEALLEPVYRALHIGRGQLEALTGIRERRYWPHGTSMAEVAAVAGLRALEAASLRAEDLGAVVYTGVCRDNLEPATACRVAEALGVGPETFVYDLSNACLGVLNGMVEIANRIELGQIRAGLVVSAESCRSIQESTLARLLDSPTLERFRLGLATFTGGSGAVGVVLTERSLSFSEHRLLGGVALTAPQYHRICRWGPVSGLLGETPNVMDTDASAVLTHGVGLGLRTWQSLLSTLDWRREDVDKVICHQVGSGHRRAILETLGLRLEQDFSTFETLGNMGTVSLPLTLGRAEEESFLTSGDRVALLGIGSGLNCLMLGLQW